VGKDFKSLKQQLKELASIINSYKSEAVQLKIVEELLGKQGLTVISAPAPARAAAPKAKAKNGRRKRRKVAAAPKVLKPGQKPGRRARRSERLGVVRILNGLIEEGFFKKAKPIGEVVARANSKHGASFKQADFSGPLLKLTRDLKLTRAQNPAGKFEYQAK